MTAHAPTAGTVAIGEPHGSVSSLLLRPPGARALVALAHGAGAGMRHPFMEAVADHLAERAIASFRYQFPYAEAGKKRPDSPRVLETTARAAVAAAAAAAPDLPVLAGGKSMGGRITSQAHAADPLPGVRGLVFLGFPLHAPGKPARKRAEHLGGVGVPMLFLQGTRDKLADLDLIREVHAEIADRARLHVVEGGDHSFHVLKRSGRTADEVRAELADGVARFCADVVADAFRA